MRRERADTWSLFSDLHLYALEWALPPHAQLNGKGPLSSETRQDSCLSCLVPSCVTPSPSHSPGGFQGSVPASQFLQLWMRQGMLRKHRGESRLLCPGSPGNSPSCPQTWQGGLGFSHYAEGIFPNPRQGMWLSIEHCSPCLPWCCLAPTWSTGESLCPLPMILADFLLRECPGC